MSKHPNTFRTACACSAPRVVLPASILVCVACDRSVKDGVVVGPSNLDKAKDLPRYQTIWNVKTDRI